MEAAKKKDKKPPDKLGSRLDDEYRDARNALQFGSSDRLDNPKKDREHKANTAAPREEGAS